MRNQIKSIFAVSLALSLAVCGCKKEDRYLRLDQSSVEFTSDGQQHLLVAVETSATWMSYCSADWLDCYSQDSATLRINIEKENASLEPRNAEITIITGDGQTRVIPVTQSERDVQIAVLPNQLLEFDSNGTQTHILTVTTTLNPDEWTFETNDTWISVVPGAGEFGNVLTVKAPVLWNLEELEARKDTIYVRPTYEAYLPRTVKIPVIRYNPNLVVWMNGSPVEGGMEIGSKDISAELLVITELDNKSWTVVTDDTESRIELSVTGGVGNKADGETLTITLPENNSSSPYTYILTFTCDGKEYKYRFIQAASTVIP